VLVPASAPSRKTLYCLTLERGASLEIGAVRRDRAGRLGQHRGSLARRGAARAQDAGGERVEQGPRVGRPRRAHDERREAVTAAHVMQLGLDRDGVALPTHVAQHQCPHSGLAGHRTRRLEVDAGTGAHLAAPHERGGALVIVYAHVLPVRRGEVEQVHRRFREVGARCIASLVVEGEHDEGFARIPLRAESPRPEGEREQGDDPQRAGGDEAAGAPPGRTPKSGTAQQPVERSAELVRRGEAVRRLSREGARDHGLETQRIVRERRHLAGQRLRNNGLRGRALKRGTAGEHLVQHHAQGVDIGPAVQVGLAQGLLGAHVRRCADGHAGLRQLRACGRGAYGPRDPEVRHDRVALREQDVRRLDVAVHDPLAMGVGKRVRHLARDARRLRVRHGASA